MKLHRHKRTGYIVKKKDERDHFYYPVNPVWCTPTASWLVDESSDWEEVETTESEEERLRKIELFNTQRNNKHLEYKIELLEDRIRNLEDINQLLTNTNNMLRNWNVKP